MKKIQQLIKQGDLTQASELAANVLRDDPANADVRALYIELLCVQGALDKADQQLDMMVRQHADFLVGAVNLRQLIRAASARADFYQGGMTATLFNPVDAMFETLLSLHLNLREQDVSNAAEAAFKLEQQRQPALADVNGDSVSDIRDLDDSLCGYLELFGTDGKFYLAKFSEIESLRMCKPQSLLDTIWRRAEIIIKDGPQGEVFVPMTYVNSVKLTDRLGKGTDWQQHHEQLVTGLGQKMLLIDDKAITLSELRSLAIRQVAAA